MKQKLLNSISKINLFVTFSFLLPFVYGCNGGGGGTGPTAAGIVPVSAGSPADLPIDIASISGGVPIGINPEPGTLLLLGGGMLAMGFVKNRMRK